jgi:hypothetical protein
MMETGMLHRGATKSLWQGMDAGIMDIGVLSDKFPA